MDHWGEFYEDLCQTKDFEGPPVVQYHSYSDPGGHCILYHGFEHTGDPERCVITDPFVRPCEDAPGCCDDERATDWIFNQCFPSDWEP